MLIGAVFQSISGRFQERGKIIDNLGESKVFQLATKLKHS